MAGERFAVVDVETSGLSVRRHRILQVAVVVVDRDGVVLDEWSSLVRPRWPWARLGPRRLHGITRRDLRNGRPIGDVLGELDRRLDGAVLCAHNAAFDAAFLQRAARRAGLPLTLTPRLCTLRLSRRLDPERARSHRLGDLCDRYGVDHGRPHDALHDARATAAVLTHLLRELDTGEPVAAGDLYDA